MKETIIVSADSETIVYGFENSLGELEYSTYKIDDGGTMPMPSNVVEVSKAQIDDSDCGYVFYEE